MPAPLRPSSAALAALCFALAAQAAPAVPAPPAGQPPHRQLCLVVRAPAAQEKLAHDLEAALRAELGPFLSSQGASLGAPAGCGGPTLSLQLSSAEGALSARLTLSDGARSLGSQRAAAMEAGELRAQTLSAARELWGEAFPAQRGARPQAPAPGVAAGQAGAGQVPGGSAHPARPTASAPTGPAIALVPTGTPPPAGLEARIERTLATVEAIRGLQHHSTLQVAVLSGPAFAAALHQKLAEELKPQLVARERARWLAFGLAPPTADPAAIALAVYDEQVAGLYDQETKKLWVRDQLPALGAAGDPEETFDTVLAHEIEHALQDQNFGIPDLTKLPDDDARLATSSLYEGDAMVTMIAFSARKHDLPVRMTVSRTAELMRSQGLAALLQAGGGLSPKLLSAPPIVRDELAMPYVAGLDLVATVFARGGFKLVNQLFAHPPSSTHEVLHPDRYLRGERPAAVATPQAPEGTRVVAADRLGELGARALFSECVREEVAREELAHWAGDAYVIYEGKDGELGVIWNSVWSGQGATPLGNMLEMQGPCWGTQPVLSNAKSDRGVWRIAPEHRTLAEGSRLSFQRGLGAQTNASRSLFAAQIPPARPPLGAVPLAQAELPTRIEGRSVNLGRLGVETTLPSGYEASVPPGAELLVQAENGPSARLLFLPTPYSREAAVTLGARMASELGAQVNPQAATVPVGAPTAASLLEQVGTESRWAVEGSALQLRVLLVPLCSAKASLALVVRTGGEEEPPALRKFLEGLRFKSKGSPPICGELQ